MLTALAAGLRAKEIARLLGVSRYTVYDHIRRLRKRTATTTNAALVYAAAREGWIEFGRASSPDRVAAQPAVRSPGRKDSAAGLLPRRWLSPILAGFLLTAPGLAAAQSVRDSGGVRLVNHRQSDVPKGRWSVSETPIVTIESPAWDFTLIAQVVLVDGARIAVADNGSASIVVFDSLGRRLRSMGRKGGGPGEFRSLWDVSRIGDSLAGFDGGSGAWQVFDPAGKYARTVRRARAASGVAVERVGFFADGALVGYHADQDRPPPGRSTGRVTVVVITPTDTVELLTAPQRERVVSADGSVQRVVFGARTHLAVFGDRLCHGFPERYEFWCRRRDGQPYLRVVREGVRPVPVTGQDRAAYLAGVDYSNPGPRGAAYREWVRRATVYAARMPAYGRMVAARDGNLWIGPTTRADIEGRSISPVPREPTRWSVFAPDGTWLSDVELPGGFRLTDADGDLIAGVIASEDGAEGVRLLRLRR